MPNYHVGCGIAEIYAGTLNKGGTMWVNKSPVTDECISAAAQYLLEKDISFCFTCGEKRYIMTVQEEKRGCSDAEH